jgi:ubiquinone/menaquinone biosynthesis C-methylase UbiE
MNQERPPQPDFAKVKAAQQQVWASGDYRRIAAGLVLMSERLCESIDLRAGDTVLDVAGGTGNAALAASRRFAQAVCTDYVPELLEYARQRADIEGLPLDVQIADAEALPFEDGTFDVVLSVVGAMFAPNQEQAASELVRVCRPGGQVALTSWTPQSFWGQVFQIVGGIVPPPPGVKPPTRWGTEAGIEELFDHATSDLQMRRKNLVFRYASHEHFMTFYRTHFGPLQTTFAKLDSEGQRALEAQLGELIDQSNMVDDGTILFPAEYLEVVATVA